MNLMTMTVGMFSNVITLVSSSYMMSPSHLGGRMSKAGSHMSISHSRKHSTLRPGDHLDGYTHSAYIYPNYYVSISE